MQVNTSVLRSLSRQSAARTDNYDVITSDALAEAVKIIARSSRLNRLRMETMGLLSRKGPDERS